MNHAPPPHTTAPSAQPPYNIPSKTHFKPQLERLIALGLLGLGALCAQAAPSATLEVEAAPKSEAVAAAEAVAVDPALYTTQTFEWNDTARKRAVPAKLYLPVGPLKPGAVPMVVFSHGIGGSKEGYSYLGRYFAAHGYASLHVQHVGSDRQLWRGNPLSIVSRLSDAAQETEALNRVKDVKFALDHILAEPVGSVINAQRLVAAGHSYGANTTLLLAGAKVDVNGTTVFAKDPRFSAAILISAPPFYGLGDPQKIVSGIDVPTLHITAMADDIQIPGYNSGVADRLALYQATGVTTQAAKVLAVFKDGSHSIFTDRMGTGGVALNPKVKVATRQLAVAFLNWLQAKDAGSLEQWSGQNAGLLARFEKAAF
ncbi:MAG: acetylhydrolase [Burkholderiales bacterium PBB3]|nr:MAG: acetylhydrolase [Burkholderiales bacterium PBB3]